MFCLRSKQRNQSGTQTGNKNVKKVLDLSESVSKNTDIVICGHDAGSKYDKAKSLNIPIWDADKLAQILEGLDK